MFYEILKDLVVPVLSPLVAVAALIMVVRQERQKILAQREHDLQSSVNAAEREVFLLRESYQVIGITLSDGKQVEPERINAFEESTERFYSTFHNSSTLYDEYFSKNKPKIKTSRLPLLFSELQIKLRQISKTKSVDNVILFALYLLLYARKNPDEDSEEIEILSKIYETSPSLFQALGSKCLTRHSS